MAATVLLAACASDPTGTSAGAGSGDGAAPVEVSDEALQDVINRAFLTDIPADDLDPTIRQTMEVAAQEWTPENQDLLETCLAENVCETGRGTLTVAFPNDNINPWRQTFRAELTAQAIASPDVARIIYSLGTDTTSWLANFNSLVAQQPDVIVMNSIYGSAIAPAVQRAKSAGIIVVEAETPLPSEVESLVDVQATSDLCGAYSQGVDQVVEDLPDPAGFALYTGIPGNASATNWQPCLVDGLESAGWEQVSQGFTQWSPQGQAQEANALFASGTNPALVAYDYTMEDFAAPFLDAGQTPPIMMSDVVNYSYLQQLADAQSQGIDARAFVANSRVWYGRIGVTAGIELALGGDVEHLIDIPYPMVDAATLSEVFDPAMPANAPVPTLFTPDQMTGILAS
ncbi:hypothetical protein ASG41_16415 [Modestobacter sp. Leaf380]|nr:hypothetical protein ASG41_16415 [Modestobacter sp. Leaf380]